MNKTNSKHASYQHARPTLKHAPGVDLPNQALIDLMHEVLTRGAKFRFSAKGQSMLPFVRDGDLITIGPLSQQQPALGSIVAFVQPVSSKLIVHRVVAIQDDTFYIRGDNEPTQNQDQVCADDILGCVTQVNRDGRQRKIGLGLERYLIAFLSRKGWLTRIMAHLGRVIMWARG